LHDLQRERIAGKFDLELSDLRQDVVRLLPGEAGRNRTTRLYPQDFPPSMPQMRCADDQAGSRIMIRHPVFSQTNPALASHNPVSV
jgi:hypothetical protein